MPHLPPLARDVVFDVRVHPPFQKRPPHSVLVAESILKGVHPVEGVGLAHAQDEVLHDGLVKLADGAQVEHRVDGTDGITPLPLVSNTRLVRKYLNVE